MHLNIKKDDIQSAERMGIQKNGDNKARKILVKFNNIQAKRDICQNKKILKDLPAGKKIYINEELTKEGANIFYEARKIVKNRELWAAYTMEGQIYAKPIGENNQLPGKVTGKRITNVKELAYYTGQTQRAQENNIASNQSSQESITMQNRQRLELLVSNSNKSINNSEVSTKYDEQKTKPCY